MNWTSFSIVLIVWILILFLSFTYFSLFLSSMYYENQILFYILTLISIVLIILGSISYFKAIFTSPGYVDKNLKFKYHQNIQSFLQIAKKQQYFKRLKKQKKLKKQDQLAEIQNLTQDSYCFKCDNIKKSRIHHCRICKECIQRMDHHCPWVGNCIGKYNRKYFILFLFYFTIILLIVSITIMADYISQQSIINHILKRNQIFYYLIIIVGLMSIFLAFSIGFLLVTQILMINQNLTTLETFYQGIYQNNPFDLGSFLQNIKEVMGSQMWFLPTKPFPQDKQYKNVGLQQLVN